MPSVERSARDSMQAMGTAGLIQSVKRGGGATCTMAGKEGQRGTG